MKTRMGLSRKFPARICAAALCSAALLAFSLCAAYGAITQKSRADVPVLVVAYDEGSNSLSRSSDVARGVIAAIQKGMKRMGFSVLDEDAIAGDLKWKLLGIRKKITLVQIVKLMSKSNKAEHQVRAVVLCRTYYLRYNRTGSELAVQMGIEGQILDLQSNQIIITDKDKSPVRRMWAPDGECNESCFMELVKLAEQPASSLGVVLGKKLARYRDVSAGGSAPDRRDEAVTGEARRRGPGSGHTMQIPYTLTLRGFEQREALDIIGAMEEQFPGYKTHRLISQQPAARRYSYVTSAKPNKLEERLTILLKDMNFNLGKEVVILFRGTELTVEKIVPTPRRPRSRKE